MEWFDAMFARAIASRLKLVTNARLLDQHAPLLEENRPA
jgi:hypothetical protein